MIVSDSGAPSNMATTDTAQTVSGQKNLTAPLNVNGDVTSITPANGVTTGRASGFAGVWLVGGETPGTSNYALLNAGPTLVNAPTGQSVALRIANANKLVVDATSATFADGVKAVFDAAGGNAVCGTATLVGGTVTVNTTAVAAGSLIFVSRNTAGGTVGHLNAPVASIVAATSFVINSSSGTDTSTVNWWIIN